MPSRSGVGLSPVEPAPNCARPLCLTMDCTAAECLLHRFAAHPGRSALSGDQMQNGPPRWRPPPATLADYKQNGPPRGGPSV